MLSLCPLNFHEFRIRFFYSTYEHKSHIQKHGGIKVVLYKQGPAHDNIAFIADEKLTKSIPLIKFID